MISDSLHLQNPSIPERQSAHYHAMCVHASYGDVELAQISLRSEALKVPIHPMLILTCLSSCQVITECPLSYYMSMFCGAKRVAYSCFLLLLLQI